MSVRLSRFCRKITFAAKPEFMAGSETAHNANNRGPKSSDGKEFCSKTQLPREFCLNLLSSSCFEALKLVIATNLKNVIVLALHIPRGLAHLFSQFQFPP
nr:hypothetical protein CFP56_27063 [Quercus suber]